MNFRENVKTEFFFPPRDGGGGVAWQMQFAVTIYLQRQKEWLFAVKIGATLSGYARAPWTKEL